MGLSRGVVITLAAGIALASAACTVLTSLDGLAGSAGDGGTEGGADGAADASSPSVDGGDGGDAGSWCKTHQGDAAFCDDFDTTGVDRWSGDFDKGGGTTKLDPTNASSPPFGLLSVLPAVSSGPTESFLVRNVPIATNDITVEADLRVEKVSAGAALLQLMKLFEYSPIAPGDAAWEVGLAVNGTTRRLVCYQYNEYSSAYAEIFTFPTPLPLDTWTRLRLHLAITGNFDGRVDLDVDGVRAASNLAVQPPFGKAPFDLLIGAVFTKPPHTGWAVRTDNVLLFSK